MRAKLPEMTEIGDSWWWMKLWDRLDRALRITMKSMKWHERKSFSVSNCKRLQASKPRKHHRALILAWIAVPTLSVVLEFDASQAFGRVRPLLCVDVSHCEKSNFLARELIFGDNERSLSPDKWLFRVIQRQEQVAECDISSVNDSPLRREVNDSSSEFATSSGS